MAGGDFVEADGGSGGLGGDGAGGAVVEAAGDRFLLDVSLFGALFGARHDRPERGARMMGGDELVPDLEIHVAGLLGDPGPVEIEIKARAGHLLHALGFGRVVQHIQHRPGERFAVASIEIRSRHVMHADFFEPACIARDDRRSRRHSFEGDDAEWFVKRGEDRDVGAPEELVERAIGHEPGEQHLILQAVPADEFFEPLAIAAADDDELGVGLLGEDRAGGIEKELDAFLADESAHVHHDFLFGQSEFVSPRHAVFFRPFELEFGRIDAIENDVDLVAGDLERPLNLRLHEFGADDDAPGLISEPVLHLVDVLLHVGEDAAVSAFLGSVDGGDDRELIFVFELLCALEREPVVGVENRGLTAGPPVFEQTPDTQVGGFVEQLDFVDEVVRLTLEVDPVDVNSRRLDFFIGRERRIFGDDVDFDAELDQLFGKVVDVGADSAHNSWRVFPRQHHHAEHSSF